MKKSISVSEILKLSVAERIQLVEDVWDSISNIPSSVPLTDSQKAILDERLKTYHENPQDGSPWADVKKELLKQK